MPDGRQRPSLSLPSPIARRAIVVGAGSFGTAVAVLLSRGGLRTTLQTRTTEQARRLQEDRENRVYLPGVELPRELRVESIEAGLGRADYVFLGVPSDGLGETIRGLKKAGLGSRTSVISLAKGLTPPHGIAPTVLLRERFGEARVACIGGPAHAREMVSEGAGLVAASTNEELAHALAGVFIRAGVVCEQSNDPIGVELAGAAKNAAGLAAGATEAQGLNAAGAAAGHIFAEVWRYSEAQGARPESMLGLAGTGDLVATVLAPQSRNRRAGELLAAGRARGRDPRADRAGRRGAGVGAAARARAAQRGARGDGHRRAGEAHLGRAAARRVDRARAHDGAAARALAAAAGAGLYGAAVEPRARRQARAASVVTTAS